MRTAVSGRLVNVYSENDYILAFLYRTSSIQYGVAGLMPVSGLLGVENVDVSETVNGHLKYRYVHPYTNSSVDPNNECEPLVGAWEPASCVTAEPTSSY